MENLRRRYIWGYRSSLRRKVELTKFVKWRSHSLVWNNHQRPGSQDFVQLLVGWVINKAKLITLFIKNTLRGKKFVLIVYIDDIIITKDDNTKMLKRKLGAKFEVKDLGSMNYFLGMEVARSKEEILISQKKYTHDLLKETKMLGCKLANTPLERNWKRKVAMRTLQWTREDTRHW